MVFFLYMKFRNGKYYEERKLKGCLKRQRKDKQISLDGRKFSMLWYFYASNEVILTKHRDRKGTW